MLEFDPTDHIYRWNGNKVPSVTEILGQFKLIKPGGYEYFCDVFTGNIISKDVFDIASDHGTAVHQAVAYHLYGGVDEEALHPDVLAGLNEFKKWQDEHVKEVIFVEKPLYSLTHGFAGTQDIYCILKKKDRKIICDIKTGAFGMAGPQLAAYEKLVQENTGVRGIIERYVLSLPKDGMPFDFQKVEARHDWNFFLSRLFTYNYINRF